MELITRLSCGCEIWRNELVNSGYELKRCPLHKAAPDLYEACKIALEYTSLLGDAKITIEKALAKAEGKDDKKLDG